MNEAVDRGEPPERMTRAAYRAWSEGRPGRYERIQGVVVAMAPERVGHNLAKANTWRSLREAILRADLPYQVFTDGMTLEIGDSDYEPDCVVRCGDQSLPGDVIAVPDPLIVAEVLSPSTSGVDRAWKLGEYFRLPSLRHYLIVWPDQPRVVHHRRGDAGSDIETHMLTSGPLALDPPGIAIALEDIYSG
jgi:Uma2 family endonuclease